MFSYENLCVHNLDYAHIIEFSSFEKNERTWVCNHYN